MFKKIEELCKEKKITIAALEKTCGFGNGTIRGWKNSSPTVDKIVKVADFFEVPLSDLIESAQK